MLVAQIDNLLYRRLAIGESVAFFKRGTVRGLTIRDTADCQSALRITEGRYLRTLKLASGGVTTLT
jgi:hypothetical protein